MKRKDWFHDNIIGLIAMGFTLFTFVVYGIVLFKDVKATETTTITVLTSITNMELLILGFYFVSSKSNKEKDKKIEELENKSP